MFQKRTSSTENWIFNVNCSPQAHGLEHLVPHWWHHLRRWKKPLGPRGLLEEMGHWGHTLKSAIPSSTSSLLPTVYSTRSLIDIPAMMSPPLLQLFKFKQTHPSVKSLLVTHGSEEWERAWFSEPEGLPSLLQASCRAWLIHS